MDGSLVAGVFLLMLGALLAGVIAAGVITEKEEGARQHGEEPWFWRTHD